MARRVWTVIKEQTSPVAGTLAFDVDTYDYDFILVTFEAIAVASATPIAAPVGEVGKGSSNLPNTPAAPIAGAVAYLSIGPGCMANVPIPPSLRFGLTAGAAGQCRIKVEGQVKDDAVTMDSTRRISA